MPLDPFFFGFSIMSAGIGLLIGLIGFILTIWVIYDSLVVQEEMDVIEKLIWIIASFLVPLIIPIIYYIVVKRNNTYILNETSFSSFKGESEIDQIEKLHELKEKGAITEKEFEKKKKELLD